MTHDNAPTLRTARANETRMRNSEEKLAARLRERGWVCIPPEQVGPAEVAGWQLAGPAATRAC